MKRLSSYVREVAKFKFLRLLAVVVGARGVRFYKTEGPTGTNLPRPGHDDFVSLSLSHHDVFKFARVYFTHFS